MESGCGGNVMTHIVEPGGDDGIVSKGRDESLGLHWILIEGIWKIWSCRQVGAIYKRDLYNFCLIFGMIFPPINSYLCQINVVIDTSYKNERE